MFSLFKKAKKQHTPTFTQQEINTHKKKQQIQSISVSSFLEETEEQYNVDKQKAMLDLTLMLISKYITKPTDQDVIAFLHPNHATMRKKILNELHVEKQRILHQLSELRHIIQRSNDEQKKQKYRTLKSFVEEQIDPSIYQLNRYSEQFMAEETKADGYKLYHELFQYLGSIEEKQFLNHKPS